mmetsp:Transcript_5290/g.15916  ORF Transcript_5290/g.15916 Transcript_5290/m.15916 type:complete len:226 (+) Transcript_5290:4035-4712(+)
MEMYQADHLLLGRLEESVLDVCVRHIQLLTLGRVVPEPIGVGLQRSGHLLASPPEGRANPNVVQDRDPASPGDELLLPHKGRPLVLFTFPLLNDPPHRLDLLDDLAGVPRVRAPEGDLLQEGVLDVPLHERRVPQDVHGRGRVKDDPHKAVIVVNGVVHILDDGYVEGDARAVDGQDHRFRALIHFDQPILGGVRHVSRLRVRHRILHLLDLVPFPRVLALGQNP